MANRRVPRQAPARAPRRRDRVAARLLEGDAGYRLMVESIKDHAIFMLDANGLVTNWNAGAALIKGYSAEEIIGQHFSVFYSPEDRRAGIPQRALETAARDGAYEAEGWRIRKDGSRFFAAVVIEPLRADTGELIGFGKITRDITRRVRERQALEETRIRLAQAQRMEAVGQLTTGIAHDFNNLLTTIIGNLDLISRGSSDHAVVAQRLVSVAHAAHRASSLTSRLLAFARRQTLAPQATDINRLITDMSELLRRTLGENIDVEAVLAGGLWRAFVDPVQLENSLLNLAINARDAMPDGGKLTVESANTYLDEEYAESRPEVTAGQYVLIAVTDSGSGMTPEVIERAFEPFFTTKSEGVGTGLGLSQVYGFVKQSGGHIALYSEVGQGTTIKIYLPRYSGADAPEPTRVRPDVTTLASGETVLLVEDDAAVRDFAGDALRLLGYRVVVAADAATALSALDAHPQIDVLLTDVALPDLNGRQLANQVTRRRPAVKVLFMTGYARNAIVHQGVLDPEVDLLAKPFTVDSLGRKLRQVIARG
ncbi:MAG TPA: PAS domain S-box protein [Stellaceae bacterium]|nr:PAS domain S-box protein [Stellaceae bacterium]